MYKVPIMPYIKLNLEKNFYMSELWAFKIGANLVYNFGMEFDMDKLKSDTSIMDTINIIFLYFPQERVIPLIYPIQNYLLIKQLLFYIRIYKKYI